MTALFAVVKLFFGEPFHIASVTINLVFFFIIGLIVGLTEWSSRETEYFKHHPAPEEIYNITGRGI